MIGWIRKVGLWPFTLLCARSHTFRTSLDETTLRITRTVLQLGGIFSDNESRALEGRAERDTKRTRNEEKEKKEKKKKT